MTSGFDAKQARLDDPSGWIELTRYQTVRLLIDALLESSPNHQFNKSELERRTGMSRESIREHIPRLIELGIIEEVENGGWPEYRLNDDGKVTKELFELNSAVNSVLAGESKESQSTEDDSAKRPHIEQEFVNFNHTKLADVTDEPKDLPDNSQFGTSEDELVPSSPAGA
jgi:DNA-binding transcriptional ArsR family regulator